MLSAARRAAPSTAAPGAGLVEHLHRLRALVLPLVSASSSKPFSTSSAVYVAPQPRLSKAKRDERLDKLARKREIRAVRRSREAQREEAARLALMQRRDEVQEKQAVAEVRHSLSPFSLRLPPGQRS